MYTQTGNENKKTFDRQGPIKSFMLCDLTCHPCNNSDRSTVRSQMMASPAWKFFNLVHFLAKKSPKHRNNSDVDA